MSRYESEYIFEKKIVLHKILASQRRSVPAMCAACLAEVGIKSAFQSCIYCA